MEKKYLVILHLICVYLLVVIGTKTLVG